MKIFKGVFNKASGFFLTHWHHPVFVVLIIVFTFLILIIGINLSKRQVTSKTVVESEALRNKLENKLSEWVYNHSKKISRGQAKFIVTEAMKTDKALLIIALAEYESVGFVPTVVSKKGCVGLMQINFNGNNGKDVNGKTLVQAGIINEKRDLFEVDRNIRSGDFLLGVYLKQSKGNVLKALDRYLGERDGVYVLEVFSNLAELYLLQEAVIKKK